MCYNVMHFFGLLSCANALQRIKLEPSFCSNVLKTNVPIMLLQKIVRLIETHIYFFKVKNYASQKKNIPGLQYVDLHKQ